jgi:hypothetical protein
LITLNLRTPQMRTNDFSLSKLPAIVRALSLALALAQPVHGQNRVGLQLVGDDWKLDAYNNNYGRNYGVGFRAAGADSYVRTFWSIDIMLDHVGPGSLLFIAPSGGATIGPRGATGLRPYALAAVGCLCFFDSGLQLSPLVGAGLEVPVASHQAYVEFQYYTRRSIRSTLTVGMYFKGW